MSYDIGPKIGIEGEAQFKSALRAITSQTKALTAEMKSVSSAFSDADSKEAKLTAQNKVLERQVQATAQKVELLRTQHEKEKAELDRLADTLDAANREFGENSEEAARAQNAYNRQAEKVNRLATQMNNAQADANRYSNELRDNRQELENLATAADDAQDATADLGDSIEDSSGQFGCAESAIAGAAGGIAATVSDKIIDVVKDATGAMLEFADQTQQAMGSIEAQTGVTGETTEELGDIARDVYAHNLADSVEVASDAVSRAYQIFGDIPEEELEHLTEDALLLSETFDFDVTDSFKTAKQLSKQFGISGEEAFNLIATGAQNGLDFSGELLDTLNEYSPQFADAGMSAEDMFDVLASGQKAGAFNLDKIGDAVKEFGLRAKQGTKEAYDGFEKLGMNAEEASSKIAQGGEGAKETFDETIKRLREIDDDTERNRIGVELFGTMWEDLGPDVITQLDGIKGGYDNVHGAMQKINDASHNSFKDNLTECGKVLQNELIAPITDRFLPTLDGAPEALEGWLEDIKGGFAEFGEHFQPIFDAFDWVKQECSEDLPDSWNTMKDSFGETMEAFAPLAEGLTVIFDGVIQSVSGVIAIIGGSISGLVEMFSGIVQQIAGVFQVLIGIVTLDGGMIVEGFQNISGGTQNVCHGMFNFVAGGFKGLLASVGIDVNGIKESVSTKFTEAANAVKTKGSEIKQSAGETFGRIKQDASTYLSAAHQTVSSKMESIKSAFSSKMTSAKDAVSGAIKKIKKSFNFTWSLPELKLPHIKIFGGFSLNPPSVPEFKIRWYKDGGVFNKPTLFNTPYGLKGVGEAGAEAVLPLSVLWDELDTRLTRAMDNINDFGVGGLPATDMRSLLVSIRDAISTGFADVLSHMQIEKTQNGEMIIKLVIDGKEIASVVTPYVDIGLAERRQLEKRFI